MATAKLNGNDVFGNIYTVGSDSFTYISVNILASGWVEDTTNNCYYNDVSVSGTTASDSYEVVGFTIASSPANNANMKYQLGLITYGITSTDSIRFIAVDQAPAINLPIILRKVL